MRASHSLLAWVHVFAFLVLPSLSVAQTNTVPVPLDSFKKLQGTWSIQSGGKTLNIQGHHSHRTVWTRAFGFCDGRRSTDHDPLL